MLRKFRHTEIAAAIVAAVEAIPAGNEIVTFKAGENSPILASFVPDDHAFDLFPEYAWDGEKWNEIGYL